MSGSKHVFDRISVSCGDSLCHHRCHVNCDGNVTILLRRRKSSQWFALTRPHAEIIAADSHFIELFKQHCRPHFNAR